MTRKFIATIVAASIAVTAIAAPARAASNDDLFKFIAGATALVIIGKAIDDNNKSRRAPVTHQYHKPQNQHKPPRHIGNRGRDDRYDDRQRHARVATMPEACRVQMHGPRGRIDGYGYQCVQRNARFANSIPSACLVSAQTNRGPRHVYSRQCVARNGYRVN